MDIFTYILPMDLKEFIEFYSARFGADLVPIWNGLYFSINIKGVNTRDFVTYWVGPPRGYYYIHFPYEFVGVHRINSAQFFTVSVPIWDQLGSLINFERVSTREFDTNWVRPPRGYVYIYFSYEFIGVHRILFGSIRSRIGADMAWTRFFDKS